jgi:hypothetical protein
MIDINYWSSIWATLNFAGPVELLVAIGDWESLNFNPWGGV